MILFFSVCHNTLRGFRGVLESPNFPNAYANEENCTWIIEAPLGNKLNLTFSHFEMEAASYDGCTYDYLEIKEGEDGQETKNIGKYCDTMVLPPKIVSTQRQVFLHFRTDGSNVHNGFRLEWVVNGKCTAQTSYYIIFL